MSDSNDDSTEDYSIEFQCYTPDEMLQEGLLLVGYMPKKLRRKNLTRQTKEDNLTAHYGVNSFVCAQVYEDLQLAPNDHGQLVAEEGTLKDFFLALCFLKLYERETTRASRFKISVRAARGKYWFMVQKICGLRSYKIYWPADNFGDDIWALSVDGTHFRTQEKRTTKDGGLNLDPRIFTYKHKFAGFNYEVGMSLRESCVVWLNVPFEAGTYNDIKIFDEKGLANKLRMMRKKCIVDAGYKGFPHLISTPNNRYDSPEVMKFKSRARLRHERFNGMMKTFGCLGDRTFRHSKEKLQMCVESVAVLCQYKMDFGEPLYDI